MANDASRDALPSHVAQGVQAITEVHAEHARRATAYDRAVERVTASLSTPTVVGLFALIVTAWIVVNVVLAPSQRFDPPPFSKLSTASSVAALLMTALILSTQRRAGRLSDRREKLILQLSIQNESKNSKIIEMLQELRRDHPEIANRDDREASDMMRATDPNHVLEELEQPVSP